MPHRRFPHPPMAGVLFAILAAGLPAQSWLPSSPYPTWSSVQPLRTLRVDYDSGKTSSENGEVLHTAMLSLQPGDELKVGSGTYTIDARLELRRRGLGREVRRTRQQAQHDRQESGKDAVHGRLVGVCVNRRTAPGQCPCRRPRSPLRGSARPDPVPPT